MFHLEPVVVGLQHLGSMNSLFLEYAFAVTLSQTDFEDTFLLFCMLFECILNSLQSEHGSVHRLQAKQTGRLYSILMSTSEQRNEIKSEAVSVAIRT